MEKRVLIAFILSFAVLYGFRFLLPQPPPAEKDAAEKKASSTPAVVPPPAELPPAKESPGDLQAEEAEEYSFSTKLYEARVSNVGGVLTSLRLKEYLDSSGGPQELIDSEAGEKVGFPLAIITADPALDKALGQAKFVREQSGQRNKVTLVYRGSGITAQKILEFDQDKYLVAITTSLQRNGLPVPHQIVLQGGFGDQSVPENPALQKAVYFSGSSFSRALLSGIKEPMDVTSSLVGMEDRYFLAMFLRDSGQARISSASYKKEPEPDGTEGAEAQALIVSVPITQRMQAYIGPKLEKSLHEADPKLVGVVDYGWFLFAVLARPLLLGLNWIYGFVGNYGWAIIVLTFLINMILFPLRVKQQLSMKKMQKIAPHMRQLQDKYKKLKAGDPKRAEVEKELMAMNKQQLSGCMPMLLQMPLLFAFLNMMNAASELRGAPWMLWITDLSEPDHLFILPVLMGLAMFIQMKMSPTSPDPAQARLMMITPVLVTILFLWFQSASGLTLYWLTGNVISIGQQWFINRHWTEDGDNKPRGRPRQPAPA